MDNIVKMEDFDTKMRCINNGRPNILTRVSIAFKRKLNYINIKRKEYNLNELSNPKISELIIKHKLWVKIEDDIINFLLDEEIEYDE